MFSRKVVIAASAMSLICPVLFLSGFSLKTDRTIHDLAFETQVKLNQFYNGDTEALKLKRFELLITDDGFIRYKKISASGKQEYFSFNLNRYKDLKYLGNTESGNLVLLTMDDDVIVQTFNDPKGNMDSMSRYLNLPLKNVEPNDLHFIETNLMQIKKELEKN
ncbi:hypothetical protein [Daejeonella oryzae]|uniref:hypothetical protein n=1 Tax=Daejeonella oryzae TaxID=1122943 RepID=UPI0003FCFA1B|nr:hypothetical protein [Daejeonella oryzae]